MQGVVYDPPGLGLPYLAVVLHEGEVVVAKAVPSAPAGEALIAQVFQSFLDAKNKGEI